MQQWYVHVRTPSAERVITVYANSRKNAVKVFQQQWGAALPDHIIDAVYKGA